MTEEENMRQMWSEEDLDEALAALNSEVPAGEKALVVARAELMAAAVSPVVIKPKRHKARWIAVIGTAAAVLASVLIVQTVSDNRPASAAETLAQAAVRIGASDPVLKTGQYLYVNTHGWRFMGRTRVGSSDIVVYLQEGTTQTWIPADRTQDWMRHHNDTDQRKWIRGSEADFKDNPLELDARESRCDILRKGPGEECRGKIDWNWPRPSFVATMPTDPQQLYNKLRNDFALPPPSDPTVQPIVTEDMVIFEFVANTVHGGLATAAQRAALYKALALMPGLEVIERTTNLDGKPGTGIALTQRGVRYELIIDPATGQPIGQRRTAQQAQGFIPAGTVYNDTVLSTAVVDKIGDKPAG
jgi:hypothetical protein